MLLLLGPAGQTQVGEAGQPGAKSRTFEQAIQFNTLGRGGKAWPTWHAFSKAARGTALVLPTSANHARKGPLARNKSTPWSGTFPPDPP